MKMLFRCLIVAIGVAALLAIAQRNQISAARTELARLEASRAVQPSKTDLLPSVSAATEEEIARLRVANRDIYKLRGQIAQAREKRKEVERMQAENAQFVNVPVCN